jgi:predicted ArsR family transcriptional regulator
LVAASDEFVVIASDFADDLDYSRQQILNRLTALAEDGYLETRQVGGRSRVFKINEEGIKRIARSDPSGH